MRMEAARLLSEGNRLRAAGRLADAAAAYRNAIAAAPDARDAHYNLAIALRQSGDLRGAILEFRAAARLDACDYEAVQNVVDTLALATRQGGRPFDRAPRSPTGLRGPVSIVVCTVDERRLQAMQSSFRAALDGRDHEFIVVRDARSLCEGYDRGMQAANHRFVVFSHDDVDLVSRDAFECLELALESHDIVGLVGSRRVTGPAVTWAGQPHLFGTLGYPAAGGWNMAVYSLATGVLGRMEALDGMLFAARREAALSVRFDGATFDGFHFYDLDFTYRCHLAGLRMAVTTEVLLIHASEGRFDDEWRRYAGRFVGKFPRLDAPRGAAFAFPAKIESREHLMRFHEQFNAMGAIP